MLRFGETKISKEKVYAAKKLIEIWGVNIYNIVISKLVKTKTNTKYLIGYVDKVMKLLVLIMSKMSGYLKTFKIKDETKDKNNKLMSFHIHDEELLEIFKAIWTKIEDLRNTELKIKCFTSL